MRKIKGIGEGIKLKLGGSVGLICLTDDNLYTIVCCVCDCLKEFNDFPNFINHLHISHFTTNGNSSGNSKDTSQESPSICIKEEVIETELTDEYQNINIQEKQFFTDNANRCDLISPTKYLQVIKESRIAEQDKYLDTSLKYNQHDRILDSPKQNQNNLFETFINNCDELEQDFSTKEKLFSCHICYAILKSGKNLKNHLLLHSGDKPFVCQYCDRGFRRKDALKDHIVVHTGERNYSCEKCFETFGTAKGRWNHLRKNQCHDYTKGFKKKDILKNHSARHTGESSFKCDNCQETFATAKNLWTHKQIEHMYTELRNFSQSNIQVEETKTDTKLQKRDATSHTFTKAESILENRMTQPQLKSSSLTVIETDSKKFCCIQCELKFSSFNELLIHNCVNASKKNKNNYSLSKKTRFRCHLCPVTLKSKQILQNHLRTHSTDKPYKCTYCPMTFSRSDGLKCHIVVHTRERNYKCGICSKAFGTSKILWAHKRNVHQHMKIVNSPQMKKRNSTEAQSLELVLSEYNNISDADAVRESHYISHPYKQYSTYLQEHESEPELLLDIKEEFID